MQRAETSTFEISGGTLENGRNWTGNALDLRGEMDPKGVREVVIEFDGGDTDTFTPQIRDEFKAYEMYQMGGYLGAIVGTLRKGQRS